MFTLDFAAMINRLALFSAQGGPIWTAVTAFCYLAAFVFSMIGMNQLKEAAEQPSGRSGYGGAVLTFLAAILLAAIPSSIATTMSTFYGTTGGPLAYANTSPGNNSFLALMRVVSLIGYFFFVRAIFELRRAGEPQRFHGASIPKALFIFASAMAAIYIDVTIGIVGNTFGWDVSNYVSMP